jgi:hypothetical protein
MAFEDDVFDISFIAGEDLSAYQYHYVELTADNTVKVCTHATTQRAIGILQNKPASGKMARVRIMGVSRAYIGTAAVAYGDFCGADADGHCITKNTNQYKYTGICIMGGASTKTATVLLYGLKTIAKT